MKKEGTQMFEITVQLSKTINVLIPVSLIALPLGFPHKRLSSRIFHHEFSLDICNMKM